MLYFAADRKPLALAGGGGAAEIADGDPGQASKIGSVNGGQKERDEMFVCRMPPYNLYLVSEEVVP